MFILYKRPIWTIYAHSINVQSTSHLLVRTSFPGELPKQRCNHLIEQVYADHWIRYGKYQWSCGNAPKPRSSSRQEIYERCPASFVRHMCNAWRSVGSSLPVHYINPVVVVRIHASWKLTKSLPVLLALSCASSSADGCDMPPFYWTLIPHISI